jgi:predicted lysophospholipase L1 biosynthesis ABC-type transport system permease subunit
MIYVGTSDRYGLAVAKYQEWCLVGMVAGMFAGAMTELAFRIFQRRGNKFSVREFMVATAIMAAAICACRGLAKMAAAPDKGNSNPNVQYKDDRGRIHHR